MGVETAVCVPVLCTHGVGGGEPIGPAGLFAAWPPLIRFFLVVSTRKEACSRVVGYWHYEHTIATDYYCCFEVRFAQYISKYFDEK